MMSQVINWICLISISILVLEVMIYFWKDVINIFNSTEAKKNKTVVETKTSQLGYTYENKIAK